MVQKNQSFFATCPKGLEALVEAELSHLGATTVKQTVAGVYFRGDLDLAYRVCLWSRLINRVLLPIASFSAKSVDAIYKGVMNVDWLQHMTPKTTFLVNFSGISQVIKNTQFGAQKIKDAIVDQIRHQTGERPSVDKKSPMLRINAHLHRDSLTISIDLSGESLHRRGYRIYGGQAPLKENLASAILIRAGWPKIALEKPLLIDPMCGSGTLLIEAFLMAVDIAPGLYRKSFGFQGWKQHNEQHWQSVHHAAEKQRQQALKKAVPVIRGYDIDQKIIVEARKNIEQAGLSEYIKVDQQDIKTFINQFPKSTGLLVTNPPYGERLSDEKKLVPLYEVLGVKFKELFADWYIAVFSGNPDLAKNMKMRAFKKYSLFNGAIRCQLLLFNYQAI